MLGMNTLAQEDIRLSLFQFLYELVCHLLQLGLVDGENLLQVLDLFEEILRHIGHRSYSCPISLHANALSMANPPLRDGFRLGPSPTILLGCSIWWKGYLYGVGSILLIDRGHSPSQREIIVDFKQSPKSA